MKSISIYSLYFLPLLLVLISSCGNGKNSGKYILAGYTEYQECLKLCDLLEAQYKTEYNECNRGCPAQEPNFQRCYQEVPVSFRESCFQEEGIKAAAFTACCQCNLDYLNNLKKVEECRKNCLNIYNRRFEVLER